MKKYGSIIAGVMVIIFSLSFHSALLAEEGHMHEKMGHGAKDMERSAEDIVVDLVCGMKIKAGEAAGKSEYKGKTYYFCMDADKKAFDADPDKYLVQMQKGESSHEMDEKNEETGHSMEKHDQHHEMMQGPHWMAPGEEAQKPNPVESDEESIARGKEIFMQRCTICHGSAGAGDGVLSATHSPKTADLSGKMVRMHPDGDVFYKISKGRGVMPAWEVTLSEEERWSLVNFIRSLSKEQALE
jgi:YHS domain-containing protein/mono/diheme cytochrome c family protein